MEEQMASTEPLADAALPAAETAAETPTPIAAPPGVPMEAPPPSLLAKEEAKETAPAPEIGQLYFERRFTSGTIYQWYDSPEAKRKGSGKYLPFHV